MRLWVRRRRRSGIGVEILGFRVDGCRGSCSLLLGALLRTTGDWTFGGSIELINKKAQGNVDAHDNDFFDHCHAEPDSCASVGDTEEVIVEEDRKNGVEQSHGDERERDANGDRYTAFLDWKNGNLCE